MSIDKTGYYKADRPMKLRWNGRIKPWEEDKVFVLVIEDRTSVQDGNEMRGRGEISADAQKYYHSLST